MFVGRTKRRFAKKLDNNVVVNGADDDDDDDDICSQSWYRTLTELCESERTSEGTICEQNGSNLLTFVCAKDRHRLRLLSGCSGECSQVVFNMMME